jgi:hypothetical protein
MMVSQLYRQLKDKVESPDYVEKLKALDQSDANTSSILLTNGHLGQYCFFHQIMFQ